MRYCARPPLAQERLGRLDDEHLGEPTEAPMVLPARSPPQGELEFAVVDQTGGQAGWPEIDQSGDSEHQH